MRARRLPGVNYNLMNKCFPPARAAAFTIPIMLRS
jgi:hypothetical protein